VKPNFKTIILSSELCVVTSFSVPYVGTMTLTAGRVLIHLSV